MTKTMPSLLVASLLALGLFAAPAQALNNRSFVSANGLDTNNCQRPTPCRTLAFAITQTNAGGEINMLDPAGYGAVTITKSISIVNDGVGSAGILVPAGGTGIIVNAGATDAVNLRGLIIEGAGVGQIGISFSAGKSLTIENCVIRNLASNGIDFHPLVSSRLAVTGTLVAENGAAGIFVAPTGSGITVKATFTRVELYNNRGEAGLTVTGFASTGTIDATATDSVAAGNADRGFLVAAGAGEAATSLMLVSSVAANNGTGIHAEGTVATLRVAQSTITGNTSGWLSTFSGVVLSYGDNYINGNTGGETPPTLIAKR